MAAQAVLTNPLIPFMWRRELVSGPPVFDSLAAAYLPVAAGVFIAAWRMHHLLRWLYRGFALVASGYAAWYLALEIRGLWQGRDLSGLGMLDGELYSYTETVGCLAVAVLRRSEGLRRIAMAAIALTVAKVFVNDMGALAGLWRVAAFLGLGLSLRAPNPSYRAGEARMV